MKKFSIQRVFAILLAMIMLATSLYTPDGAASAAAKSARSIKSVKLKIGVRTVTKKTFTMIKGRTRQLKVTVKPASSKKSVTYRSTNSKIVSVSKKGNMKAKKYGAAKIVVKVVGKNGVSKKSWVKIKVSKKKTTDKTTDEKDPDKTDTPSDPETPGTTDEPDTPSEPETPGTSGTSGVSGTPGYSGGGSWGGSGGYRPGDSSDSSNDQKEIVSTQEELLAALKKQPEKVTFKTDEEVTVQIPRRTYKSTILVVDAPKATITNEAVYKKIQIKAIKSDTWIEKAIDNLIDVVAEKGAHIKVEAGAKAEIQINEGAGRVEVENEGTIDKFTLSAKATLLISGNNQNRIPLTVDEKGKDATVNTSVPLDVTAQASIVLQLHSGAEKTSTIQVSNAGAMPTIVAAIWGCLQVTNMETKREDDVLVTMPKPGDPGFETAASPKEYGSVTGTVKSITADDKKAEDAKPLQGAAVNVIPYERGILESDLEAAVKAAQSQQKCYTGITSSEGKYTVDNIPYGNYVIVVKADKLQTYLYTIILSEKSKQIDTITMVPLSDGTGNVEGVIKDAFTGEPVTEKMKLYLRKGAGTVAGEAIKETETGEGGKYSFTNLPTGVYTIRVVDERPSEAGVENYYINVTFNVIVLANTTIYQEMTITKAIADDQIRFVLRWGKESVDGAKDLDSHLIGPKASESGLFHTYFGDKSYPENTKGTENIEAGLDVDDVDWEGPETTTVYKKTAGEYHFYVYDFSEGGVWDNEKLAVSQAKVDIYLGGRLLTAFNVPDGTGNLWDVCTYDAVSKEVTPVNKLYDYPMNLGCEGIGLTERIKESLNGLISRYDGKETNYFGDEAAAGVRTKIQEAKKKQESLKDFGEAAECFAELKRDVDKLSASTCIEDVKYAGARKCNIYRHALDGYSEIYLSGDGEEFPKSLEFQCSSKDARDSALQDSENENYQKKVIITNSSTKAKETYYIHYEQYKLDLGVSGITATGNKNIRWITSDNIPAPDGGASKISVLSITGSALELADPKFTFYSSYDGVEIAQNYKPLDGKDGYVGMLEVKAETFGEQKEYYVTYGSLLEPDNVTAGTNKINSWYVEHAGINGGKINCIYIYGAESQLTTGAALVYNVTNVASGPAVTYEPMENPQEGCVGKFTVSYNNSTKEYLVKYGQGFPELELIYIWEAKNSISSVEKLPEKYNGNAVYEVKGSISELGNAPSCVFNVNVKSYKVTPAASAESSWNYQLDVTYEDETKKTIYIKYTKVS